MTYLTRLDKVEEFLTEQNFCQRKGMHTAYYWVAIFENEALLHHLSLEKSYDSGVFINVDISVPPAAWDTEVATISGFDPPQMSVLSKRIDIRQEITSEWQNLATWKLPREECRLLECLKSVVVPWFFQHKTRLEIIRTLAAELEQSTQDEKAHESRFNQLFRAKKKVPAEAVHAHNLCLAVLLEREGKSQEAAIFLRKWLSKMTGWKHLPHYLGVAERLEMG